jgi:hypothetical protein
LSDPKGERTLIDQHEIDHRQLNSCCLARGHSIHATRGRGFRIQDLHLEADVETQKARGMPLSRRSTRMCSSDKLSTAAKLALRVAYLLQGAHDIPGLHVTRAKSPFLWVGKRSTSRNLAHVPYHASRTRGWRR